MLAADRALAIVLIAAFFVVAPVVARKFDSKAERASWWALGAGIAIARAGYVASNWDAFAVEPASILAIWQGGFSVAAGVAGAVAAIVLTMRPGRAAIALVGAIALLSGVYLGGSILIRPDPKPLPATIALEQWSGQTVSLSEFRGQPFAINLWASWCLPCRREMPMLVDVASRSRVPILLVNSGEDRGAADSFLRANRLPSESVYLDQTAALATATGASGYPVTLFVNAAGRIETMHLGEISRPQIKAELRLLERGRR